MEQTQAESSPVMEVERGPLVNLTSDQRAEWRRTGDLPEVKVEPKVESAPTQNSEPAKEGDQAPPKTTQGKRKPEAEDRIKQLTDDNKRIRAELEALKTPKVEPKASTKTEPIPKQEASSKPTPEDKDKDGKAKYATYEEYVEALADWKAEERWSAREKDQQQQTQKREFESKVADAKQRYGDKFDEIVEPTAGAIMADKGISPVVHQMLRESDHLPDLIFTIGSDPKELASFLQMAKTSPGKALRYIALTESLIADELSGGKAKEPPAKPETKAPKPPSEVGGRAATPGDALESAIASSGGKLTPAIKAEMTRRQLAKLKG